MLQVTGLGRLARRYPRTTTGVVLANALPLLGVLVFGWSVGLVLLFYWLESGIVLLFTMLAALVASEPGDTSGDDLALEHLLTSERTIRLREDWPPIRVRNVPIAASAGIAFGFFWVAHGVLVAGIAVQVDGPAAFAVGPWILAAILGVALNQSIAFHDQHVVERRYREETAKGHLWRILVRTMVLHVVLLIGGAVVAGAATVAPGAGLVLLALLVVAKAPLELGQALHRRASADTDVCPVRAESDESRAAPNPSRTG